MQIPIKEKKRYIAGIDGLRAIAVLSVIAYHLNIPWAQGGLLGVVIFFVLSGYLITDLIVIEWKQNKRINLIQFWKRRIRRLFPALFVMLILVMAWITLFDRSLIHNTRGDLLASFFYISNWWFIFHKVSYFESFGTPSPFNHLWSLAVEEQFYIFWPLVLSIGFKYKTRKPVLIGFIFLGAILSFLLMAFSYQPGTDPSRVYYGTDTRVFSLLFGAILALIWPSRNLSKQTPKSAQMTLDILGSASLVTILIMICLTNQFDPFLYKGGMLLTSIAAFILVAVLAHPASQLSKLLAFKPLRWLGVRSYSIYLWHYPVILFSSPLVDDHDIHLLLMLFQLFLIIVLSDLSLQFIENPIRHGAIGTILKSIKEKKFLFKQTSLVQKLMTACSFVIIVISCVGMTSSASGVQDLTEKVEKNKIFAEKMTNTQQDKNMVVSEENQSKNLSTSKQDSIQSQEDMKITAIGDSVMVMAAPYLEKEYPEITIDAKIGRQMSQAPCVIDRLQSEGRLGNVVIIELGTNGPFTKDQLVSLISSLGSKRKVILINSRVPRPWEQEVNSIIKEVATSSSNINLIDWYSASVGKDSYFYQDGVHPNQQGAQIYVSLIKNAVQMDKEMVN
ncbi:acyltransferase family protein [Neobacillus cucumis]|uniref:acyltransferase family protein n=1 Tax=Neobacillus cucumis TaxID=1740721 RepID=UPI002E1BF8F7|nr:acyltransferase family protein [Neobacillus cucumis]